MISFFGSECVTSVNNLIDVSSLPAYGSWRSALPIANIKNRVQGIVARSTDATAASSKFRITTGFPYHVKLISILNHNISSSGTIRITRYSDSGFTTLTYDSGTLPVWPDVFSTAFGGWDDTNPGLPRPYNSAEKSGMKYDYFHILPEGSRQAYWQIEIVDTTNTDGYIQLGRVFIGPAWQPTYNMKFGYTLGWETDTEVIKAMDGTEYFNIMPQFRVVNFELGELTQAEALQSIFEFQRMSSIDKEVVFIYDDADNYNQLRRRFMGRLRKLNPIEYPNVSQYSVAFEIKETL